MTMGDIQCIPKIPFHRWCLSVFVSGLSKRATHRHRDNGLAATGGSVKTQRGQWVIHLREIDFVINPILFWPTPSTSLIFENVLSQKVV